jgi:hypothetical protein
MLSTLVYEAADFAYTLGRLVGRMVRGVFSLYSSPQNKLDVIEKKIKELEEERMKLSLV